MDWLKDTEDETREYFYKQVELMGILCMGRNLKNTPVIRELLPYNLVLSIVRCPLSVP